MKKTLIFLFLFLPAVSFLRAQSDSTTLTNIGDRVPSFSCTTLDGREFDTNKLQGKVLMINFFATWCGPCQAELPEVQAKIWEKYKDRPDFELIIIGREHKAEEISAFLEEKKFTMPFAPDPEREIYSLFATQFIPRNVIVSREGKILFQNKGYNIKEGGVKELTDILEKELQP